MAKRTCSFVSDEGVPCGRPVDSWGLCAGHDKQQRRGRPLTVLRNWRKPASADPHEWYLAGFEDAENGCFEWQRGLTHGYGKCRDDVGDGSRKAHRVMWILHHAEIPDDLHVLHTCDNRRCALIDHLFLGTNPDNIADMVAKGRQQRGSCHSNAKLTEAQVLEIRSLPTSESSPAIAERYGVAAKTIREILGGKTWRHLL